MEAKQILQEFLKLAEKQTDNVEVQDLAKEVKSVLHKAKQTNKQSKTKKISCLVPPNCK